MHEYKMRCTTQAVFAKSTCELLPSQRRFLTKSCSVCGYIAYHSLIHGEMLASAPLLGVPPAGDERDVVPRRRPLHSAGPCPEPHRRWRHPPCSVVRNHVLWLGRCELRRRKWTRHGAAAPRARPCRTHCRSILGRPGMAGGAQPCQQQTDRHHSIVDW